ncbi:Mitochondrial intermediate peptidase [Spiromyces aspiralis]|uniref:Mitochondrial intermediate peptidase n=1 Tax=Spiromyces aspiralis TaxID=68401 RepID=A0ACC1HK40_9FUNG|nr:Mitochondrial intermediate peptidase [Spiromyces aspiralis]
MLSMPHSTAAACTGRDHGDLHLFFDDPGLARHPPAPQGEPTGLFLDPRFRSPPAFRQAADSAVRRAQQLVGAIEAAEAKQELRMVVKYFDQLSDTLCQVMDVAELVRQSHPDCEWKATAEEIYSSMLEYMNGLNTHVGLYKVRYSARQ